MLKYLFHEGSIDLPEGTRDDSVQIFTIPVPDVLPLSLTIRRQVRLPEIALADWASADLTERGRRDSTFALHWRRAHSFSGRSSVIAATSYDRGNETVGQRIVYVDNGRTCIILTISVPGEFQSTQLNMTNSVFGSLRLTDPE
ncbi:hypothetical protein AA101099_1470 [Neoasaia chiangmaiensis NBRC 101099]|uniref:Uncharacterized protein n=1 Tax=Neoasaia chiangmaiensis TaxID=320497 RepID=A0A1U9KQ81_9PROT|nr:DcrB-related protein [Neoasaia chiangmaiensis]AQS87953.1 hypothetical protein A0U93_08375 [Neoasaia chiangmaiensis]GBR38969.1 hypothetical protein AA101099_1470 [Neoasaia chiangmaiensis NBRC 101099]GEN15612.1 hypothetical protein NCH01_20430 [Neoasaia chiangmaiensis]